MSTHENNCYPVRGGVPVTALTAPFYAIDAASKYRVRMWKIGVVGPQLKPMGSVSIPGITHFATWMSKDKSASGRVVFGLELLSYQPTSDTNHASD